MARRPGLSPERIVEAAAELVDAEGPEALTLAALAKRFEVKTPSLYNHIDGLDDARRSLALHSLRELTEQLRRAVMGRSGSDALASLAQSYRDFAKRHPGQYACSQRSVEGSDPELEAAGRDALEVVLAVLRDYRLEGDEVLHAARALRSALHGFVLLETGGGFGLDLDVTQSYRWLLKMFEAGLTRDVPA
jgi:AcrR family transcriptional regulator